MRGHQRHGGAALTREARGFGLALTLVSLAWALVPMLPALLRGELPGSPYTDLYPSVWGLGWFMAQQPGLPTWCMDIAAPSGMAFYYSSPMHGWIGWPVYALMGGTAQAVVAAYAFGLALARAATVGVAGLALRQLGAKPIPAVGAALLYGASPFFQGYATEGIVEGTDGWALPLWVLWVSRRSVLGGAVALWLAVLSSWYLGMVVCAGAVLWGFWNRAAWWSLIGVLGTVPLLVGFAGMAGGTAPLHDAVRIAMGLQAPRAPWWEAPSTFALTTWTGLSALVLAVPAGRRAPWLVAAGLGLLVLSSGWGPWYELPVLRSVRFPYRWHAGTLFVLAVLVSHLPRWGWLAFVPFVEALAFAPIAPMLPSSPAVGSALYAKVRGPLLLDMPGPLSLPPGMINPSRPRARYLLFAQVFHGARSPWVPDFNSVASADRPGWLASFAGWEPILDGGAGDLDLDGARAAGVTQILIHKRELRGLAEPLLEKLRAGGGRVIADQDGMVLVDLGD